MGMGWRINNATNGSTSLFCVCATDDIFLIKSVKFNYLLYYLEFISYFDIYINYYK